MGRFGGFELKTAHWHSGLVNFHREDLIGCNGPELSLLDHVVDGRHLQSSGRLLTAARIATKQRPVFRTHSVR